MYDEEKQRKIFAKNLNYFIDINNKQQKDVAKDLGFKITTFNTWCKGKIIPSTGKIQKIADYFGIGKSDLLDDKLDSADPAFDARIINDSNVVEMIRKFYKLSLDDRSAVIQIIDSLARKAED